MSDQPQETPILDLLEAVPIDARVVYEHSTTHHQNIPFGRLAVKAAKRIRQLEAENIRLRLHRSKLDCRYAGKVADTSGSHCPIEEPCLRCRAEAAEAEFAALLKRDTANLKRLIAAEALLDEAGGLPDKWRNHDWAAPGMRQQLFGEIAYTASGCANELAALLGKREPPC